VRVSIEFRNKVAALEKRVEELEKTVAMLRESVAYLQGEQVMKKTLTLPKKANG
jgi:BMFP domain-containing protein YqiC